MCGREQPPSEPPAPVLNRAARKPVWKGDSPRGTLLLERGHKEPPSSPHILGCFKASKPPTRRGDRRPRGDPRACHRCRRFPACFPRAGTPHGREPLGRARGVAPGRASSCLACAFAAVQTEIILSPFYFNKDIPRHYLQAHIIYLRYLAKQLRKRK